MTSCTKAAFARRMGCARSYVSKLEKAGRLVLTEDGRVDPEASLARIRETAAPGRAGIHDRGIEPEADDYQQWRSRREAALAAEAELQYRLAVGELVPAEVAKQLLQDRGTLLRAEVEQLPVRLAWAGQANALADALAVEIERIIEALGCPLEVPQGTRGITDPGQQGGAGGALLAHEE